MKKYIFVLLILSLILGMLVACGPGGTESSGDVSNDVSVGDVSNGVSADTSIDESDDTSSDESGDESIDYERFSALEDLADNSNNNDYYEVTDENEISNIKSQLNLYNQYVLIKNLCEGSVEIDKTVKVEKPKFEILDWFTVDFTSDEYWDEEDPFTFVPECYDTYYDYGYRVTDDRFKHQDDFKEYISRIFVDKLAKSNFYLFFGCTDHFGKDAPFSFHSISYPPFITADGVLYSVIEFNEYAELPERYIDLDSIKVMKGEKGYVVTARGSSIFADGEVQAPDSDVKILLDLESKKIINIQAIRDHISSFNAEYNSEFEKIKATIERYCSINDIFETLDESKPVEVKNRYTDLCYKTEEFYLCKSEIYRSFTDVYDWYKINDPSLDYEFIYWYMGQYSTYDFMFSPLIAYTEDGLMVLNDSDASREISVDVLSKGFFNKCELEIKDGQIIFSYTSDEYDEENEGYLHEEVVLERIDEFGDGEYTYKIVKCECKYIEK